MTYGSVVLSNLEYARSPKLQARIRHIVSSHTPMDVERAEGQVNMDGIGHTLMKIGVRLASELAPDHELNEDGINVRPSQFQEAKTQVDTILDMNKMQERSMTEEVAALDDTLARAEAECNSPESQKSSWCWRWLCTRLRSPLFSISICRSGSLMKRSFTVRIEH